MRKLLASTALAVILGASGAHADMRDYSHTNGWASSGGTNNEGYAMCELSSTGAFDGSYEGMMLKYSLKFPTVVSFQFGKQNWNIPSGTHMRVVWQVDNAPARYFTAHQAGRPDLIEVDLDTNDIDPGTGEPVITLWTNLLRSGATFKLWFPQGSEQPWTANLNGSAAELTNMASCMRTIMTASGKTQPFSGATQPYGNSGPSRPAPATQPYTPL